MSQQTSDFFWEDATHSANVPADPLSVRQVLTEHESQGEAVQYAVDAKGALLVGGTVVGPVPQRIVGDEPALLSAGEGEGGRRHFFVPWGR